MVEINDFTAFNIRGYLNSNDIIKENELKKVISEYSCCLNYDVENFLKKENGFKVFCTRENDKSQKYIQLLRTL